MLEFAADLAERSDIADLTPLATLSVAHFAQRVCLSGAYAVYVMSLLDEQQRVYMRIFLEQCPHVGDMELGEYVNEGEDGEFVQVWMMPVSGQLSCAYMRLVDFAVTVAASLEDCSDAGPWAAWQRAVRNSQNVPEFVMTLVMQMAPDAVRAAFPGLRHNFWRADMAMCDGVQPRSAVVRTLQQLARRVDLGEWYKHAVVARTQPLSASPAAAHCGLVEAAPGGGRGAQGETNMALTTQVLAYMVAEDGPGVGTGVGARVPPAFTSAPHVYTKACQQIRANAEGLTMGRTTIAAAKGVLADYKFAGAALREMGAFRRVFPHVVGHARLPAEDAHIIIADLGGRPAPASVEVDYIVLTGRVLGAEFDLAYHSLDEDGVCGLVGFLHHLGVDARAPGAVQLFRWFQLETGLLVQVPRAVTRHMEDGAALFASFVFPVAPHVGHPLLRYGALVRMIMCGGADEIAWAVRTLYFLHTGDAEESIERVAPYSDAAEIAYVRASVTSILGVLLSHAQGGGGGGGGIAALPHLTALDIGHLVGVFLSLMLTGRCAERLQIARIDEALDGARLADTGPTAAGDYSAFRERVLVPRGRGEWYPMTATFLAGRVASGTLATGAVLAALARCDLVQCERGGEGCGVIASPIARTDVAAAVRAQSCYENWAVVPRDDEGEAVADYGVAALEPLFAVFLGAECVNMGVPLTAHLDALHRRNFAGVGGGGGGVGDGIRLADIRFPLTRVYNSIQPRIMEHEAFIMARIGDLLDPVVRRREVLAYYNQHGEDLRRMHRSVFYAATPWMVSDILKNRRTPVARDSPLASTGRQLLPFDLDILRLAPNVRGRPPVQPGQKRTLVD